MSSYQNQSSTQQGLDSTWGSSTLLFVLHAHLSRLVPGPTAACLQRPFLSAHPQTPGSLHLGAVLGSLYSSPPSLSAFPSSLSPSRRESLRPVELPSATHTHHSWIRPRQGSSNPPPPNGTSTKTRYLHQWNTSNIWTPDTKSQHENTRQYAPPKARNCVVSGPEESRLAEAYNKNLCFYVIRHGLIL